jgi:hypothetical protein
VVLVCVGIFVAVGRARDIEDLKRTRERDRDHSVLVRSIHRGLYCGRVIDINDVCVPSLSPTSMTLCPSQTPSYKSVVLVPPYYDRRYIWDFIHPRPPILYFTMVSHSRIAYHPANECTVHGVARLSLLLRRMLNVVTRQPRN